ncbi:MAG: FxsA family protein [Nautiliaceae bacterium]
MGLVYFLVYLFLEILFSYEFARVFTPFGLFLEVIFTALFGAYIIKNLHLSLFEEMQKVLRREISEEEFIAAGLFRLVGAFLLIIPGVFSDLVGFLFLFEPFARWVGKKIFKREVDDGIIDVEVIDERDFDRINKF